MVNINTDFMEKMRFSDEFNASACINCGTCTALCPMETGLLPRHLFRYVLLGIEEKVLEHTETIYSCLLCKMCEDNCPAGVHIAENIRTLRVYLNENIYHL